MIDQILLWIGFHIFIFIMLAIDLGVFNRKAHAVGIREALRWSCVWIGLALLFNLGIYLWQGADGALQFLTGYLLEKSLSVDNLFVFLLIFSYFHVPPKYQHRILFWGIIGALFMRGAFIFAGITLIKLFHPVIYIFGAFLVFTGIKMAVKKDDGDEIHPEKNPVLNFFRIFLPIIESYKKGRFFVRIRGHRFATMLFVVLIMVETTDILFAVDSIPAILAITLDPFIVYTSNVLAILGLRSLYFALSGMMQMFRYLHYGLSGILVFIGAKMIIAEAPEPFHYEMPITIALAVLGLVLLVSVIASVMHKEKPEKGKARAPEEEK